MEGLGHDRRPPLSHGFKVGVGSVAVAALYERLLDRDLGALDVEALRRSWPTREQAQAAVRAAHTTPGLDEAAVAETTAKWVDADALGRRLTLLADRWPALHDRLRGQLLPAERLQELLAAAGCPTRPSELGPPAPALRATYARARMIRRRYTVLDLAFETGLLGELVDELFRPGGFWPS
jgi:glycerol-1-phosphate dehydrogenase [NAD(P)+]